MWNKEQFDRVDPGKVNSLLGKCGAPDGGYPCSLSILSLFLQIPRQLNVCPDVGFKKIPMLSIFSFLLN